MLEQWVIDKLSPLKAEKLIILADPQRMIRAGAQAVDGWAKSNGFTVLFCSGNLALREMYENLRDDPSAKIILVDRTREKSRLPLFYPDLEARCKPKARLTITLRDFLIGQTGDQRWPLLVNSDRNLSRLILDHQETALAAYRQLRDVDEHRFQDSDLYKIVLGATLNVNPFKKLSAGEIRRTCIENHERLEKIKDLFSTRAASEAGEVLAHLKGQIEQADKPWCWMLDNDPRTVVRAFTLAAIMHQHGLEYEVLLANFDVSLERFKAIPKRSIEYTIKDMLKADPDQIADDVASVEEFLKEEPEKRLAFLLAERCRIDNPDYARKVLLTEKLSSLIRSMALLSLLIDLLTHRKREYHKAILDDLDEEGTKGKDDKLSIAARRPTLQWETLVAAYRRTIQFFEIAEKLNAHVHKLRVLKPEQLQFEQFLKLWNDDQANRLDYYTSGLRRLLQVGDILPVSENQFWPHLRERRQTAEQKLKESITAVGVDLDAANASFQDLYQANYVKWINQADSPVIFTHQFVSRVLKRHWDAQSGQKAVVLIFDGLRVDAWEELVRPVLEEKYDVLERLPGSAILPSETQLSRKAISAGCLPVNFCSTTENALLENALTKNLGLTVKFKVKSYNDAVECGISAHYTSDLIDVVIFNFTDKNLHGNHADLAFIYDATVREILRQDVRSVLREMPNDAAVFVTSDHGFAPVPDSNFTVPDEVVTDSGDVKYRVGRLKRPLEGTDAKNGVIFKVGDLGIPDKTGKAKWSFNHVLFPRPGLTLKRPHGRHDPERYTHGGLSLAECMIPMVVFGPKGKFEPPFDLAGIRFEGVLSEGEALEIVITARAKTAVKEEILIQLQVEAGLDDVQQRKEVFVGTELDYRLRWTPKVDHPTPDEQRQGKIVKQVTAIASYSWQNRTVRRPVHGTVEIQLDTTRIRRRLDSKLDSIMGMVPAGLREYERIMNTRFKDVFRGKVVNKRLTVNTGVDEFPRFVVEYLIDNYCTEENFQEDLQHVVKRLRENFVHGAEAEKIRHQIRETRHHNIIANLEVRLQETEDKYWGTIGAINESFVNVTESLVRQYPMLLSGGMWGTITLTYDETEIHNKKIRPFKVTEFTPFQISLIDLNEFIEKRKQFEPGEWLDFLINSIGLNPDPMTRREKLLYLWRLVPMIEANCNTIELAPRETGKTYIYRNQSYYVTVLSGGRATPASLFINNATGKVGVVGSRDAVVFDEIANTDFTDPKALVSIMQGYMQDAKFSRGKNEILAFASIVLVGNIDIQVQQPHEKYYHLFEPLPDFLQVEAFIDRLHGYLPGWEIPKIHPGSLAQEYGFITDYFCEIMHELRRSDVLGPLKGRYQLMDASTAKTGITGRDVRGVEKVLSGLLKLMYPHGEVTDEQLGELLEVALEGRQRVRNQLHLMAAGEYGPVVLTGKLIQSGRVITPNLRDAHREQKIALASSPRIGEVNGLAVIGEDRGCLLRFEMQASKGSGRIISLGSMQKVMKESVAAAAQFIKTHSKDVGLPNDWQNNYDIAVLATMMGVPKEGPSAGITITTGIVSALTGRPVRNDIAMTGEITIMGKVLAIGGVLPKLQAAIEAGCTEVIMPKENERDVQMTPEYVRSRITVRLVSSIEEVLAAALLGPP